MITIREYVRPASLEEAWTLNQKRTSRVIGGMLWLKMQNAAVGTAIDLSGLGLDKIEETPEGFAVGAARDLLRALETHAGLNSTQTARCARSQLRHINRRTVSEYRNARQERLRAVRLFRCAHGAPCTERFGRAL